MVEKAIFVCSCHNQSKKAREAFELICPGELFPPMYKGRDVIYKFAKARNNDHLVAISRLSGRYMYYIEMEGDDIIKEIDLTTGKRLK